MSVMQQLMTGAMNNPDVLALGVAGGFIIGYMKAKNKFRNQGMGMNF